MWFLFLKMWSRWTNRNFSQMYTYSVRRVISQYVKCSALLSRRSNMSLNGVFRKTHFMKTSSNFPICVANHTVYPSSSFSSTDINFNSDNNDQNDILPQKPVSYLSDESINHLAHMLPERLCKRKRKTDFLYLVDPDIAVTIAEKIKNNTTEDCGVILEANPGLALLSKELMTLNPDKLLLYESSKEFANHLKVFESEHQDKVTVMFTDIFALWKLSFQDKMDNGNRVEKILCGIPKRDWKDDPAMKIVGTLPSMNFFKHLIMSLTFQTGIMMHSRPELHVLLAPSLHEVLTGSRDSGLKNYRSSSILFQLFFDYKLLEKVPRKAFFPWETEILEKTYKKMTQMKKLDREVLYLMKIVPKRDLYETVASPEKLPHLWHFVKHHYMSRRNRVIPNMEQWIPGCGIRLILDNFSIFDEWGDLSPSRVLHLFHQFSSWPEYPECSFVSSLELTLIKMEENACLTRQVKKKSSVKDTVLKESEIN